MSKKKLKKVSVSGIESKENIIEKILLILPADLEGLVNFTDIEKKELKNIIRSSDLIQIPLNPEDVYELTERGRDYIQTELLLLQKQGIQTIQAIPKERVIKSGGGIYSGLVIEPLGNFEYIFNMGGKRGTKQAIQDQKTKAWYIEIDGVNYYFDDRPLEKVIFRTPSRRAIEDYIKGSYKTQSGSDIFDEIVKYLKILYDVKEEKYYHLCALGSLQSWIIDLLNSVSYLSFGAKCSSSESARFPVEL